MTHTEENVQDQPALRGLADDPASRKKFLKLMGGGVAGATAFTLFLAACGGDDKTAGTTATTAPAGRETETSWSTSLSRAPG